MVFSRVAKLAVALLALPALAVHAGSSYCKYSDGGSCAIDDLSASDDDGSVLIYPGGDTRCAFDDYTDSVTTFVSNSTYFFQVFPSESQDKSKLMVVFGPGGACVDKYTCDFALQCQLGASSLMTTAAAVGDTGIMNRSMDDNMFNDWNIIYIPYCTGDLHVGNAYLDAYESVYNQVLGNQQCLGQNIGMHMNGYNNTKAVMDWALENYPEPEHLVVGGESAGALGAQIWSTYAADQWQVEERGTRFQVLVDSYVGVFPEYEVKASSLINYFGACELDLKFPDSVVEACVNETATATDMVGALMAEVPSAEWLFIDSIADHTQRKFYMLVLEGIAGYPFSDLWSADEFYGNMTEILDTYAEITSVARFNIDSEQHVWLTSTNYTETVDLEGDLLGDVLTAWLADDSTTAPATETPTTETPTTETPATVPSTAPTTSPTPCPTPTPSKSSFQPLPTTQSPSPSSHSSLPTTSDLVQQWLCALMSSMHISSNFC